MGDLNRGATSTFAAGDTITAAKLHKLVDDAELKALSVTTAKLADGAVTDAKLAAGITITAAKVTLPENNILLGNALNVGAHLAVGATLQKTGTLDVADAAIVTAKVADGAVTSAKLATISPSPAGTYGSGSLVPVVVVNDKGQVTAVTTQAISVSGVTKSLTGIVSLPSAGAFVQVPHSQGAGAWGWVYLECQTDDAGYSASIPHRVPIECFYADVSDNDFPAFGVSWNASNAEVVRLSSASTIYVHRRNDGVTTAITPANWRLRAVVIS